MRSPKLPFLPFWIYVSVSLLVTVYVLIIGNFGPQHYELAALPILLLAMPWSFIFPNFRPRLIASDYNNSVLIMLIFIALNGAILFGLGLAADALVRRSKKRQV
jgi:hypothetical protein